jgi:hypothetical protein
MRGVAQLPATNNWSDVQVISPCTGFMHYPAADNSLVCKLLRALSYLRTLRDKSRDTCASAVCARGYKAPGVVESDN